MLRYITIKLMVSKNRHHNVFLCLQMNKLDIEVWFKVCINYNAIDSLQNAIYGFQTYFQAKFYRLILKLF